MTGYWDYCLCEPAIVLAAWVEVNESGGVLSVINGEWYSYVVLPMIITNGMHCRPSDALGLREREAFHAGYWAWAGPANERELQDVIKGEEEAWAEWSAGGKDGGG